MIDWNNIETVLLDMDGTLLDLHYDNYFWQQHLPAKWAEKHEISLTRARESLLPRLYAKKGTLSWYCIDYWSRELEMDIMTLKADIEEMIEVRPHAVEFMTALNNRDKTLIMVTNAHRSLISVKMKKTGISGYFYKIFSAHDLGYPKEDVVFWEKFRDVCDFDVDSTVLIDDNHDVLRSARSWGLKHLYSIAKPDSQGPARKSGEFVCIDSFSTLI